MDKLDSPERRGDSPESKQDSPERQTDRTHTEEHTQEENKNVTQEERKDDNKDDDKRESTEDRRHTDEHTTQENKNVTQEERKDDNKDDDKRESTEDRRHTDEHTTQENKNVTQEERKDDNKDDDKRESTESRRHREERRHDRDYDRRDSTEYRRHKDERRYERDYDRRDSTEYRRHKDERRYERDYDRRDSSEYRRHRDDYKDYDRRDSSEYRRHRDEYRNGTPERKYDRDYDRRDSAEYRRHRDHRNGTPERKYDRDYDRRDSAEYRRHRDHRNGTPERRYERDYDRRDSSEYRRRRDDYRNGTPERKGQKRKCDDDYDRRDSSEYRRHRDEYTSRGKRKYDDYGDDSRDDSDDQDINERTEVFEIKVSHEVQPDEFTLEHPDFQNVPSTDPARMSEAGYTTKESVEQLWKQKSRMDDVFDEGKSGAYYTSRDKIWPQDSKGSNRFRNRAGDKLLQVHRAMVADGILDIFEGVRGSLTFLDVCGGPGAFSQMLLVTGPMLSEPVIGYGITLKIEGADASLNWYNQLTSNENFNVLWGKDGTGNVYIPENLASVKTAIEEAGHSLDLVVADGGFGIKKVNGEHRENYQEVYSSRIVISEMLMCLMSLRDGGHFVCKLFDSLSHITQSIIYLCAQVFQECFVVKPERSRIVNSERYLVGKFLRREGQYKAKFDFLLGVLSELHARCTPGESPLSIIPISVMRDDTLFMETTQKMVVSLITKQTRALRIVMDETEKLVENGWRDHKKGRY
eukprot:TRINITY_DN443_c0_g1_i2.p1 TRINITY_DN443_c0_g1~~TRINITY_DN443_c0_g1_i2.p1  ORF type:complete len:749 (+),score=129.27 TRINITY_DN443_c0_g1_i2:10-2256(+)